MTYSLRPARRSEAKPLIGLYAESGKGKTYSSLLLARGFVGPAGRIAMIETEGGRGEAFCDLPEIGGYDVISLRENFSPMEYGKALDAAEAAKPDALIIDSASHEWEGAGGVLDMAAQNQANGKKGVIVWQQPKMQHQRHFMLRLMQTPIPLVIVCMRAKYPMKEVPKPGGGKEWVRVDTLEPKQSDDILFEMFVHGWIDDQHRLHTTKLTRRDLADVLRDGEPISLETGKRLAAWSRGEGTPGPAAPSPAATLERAREIARAGGTEAFRQWWAEATRDLRAIAQPHLDEIKKIAADADAQRGQNTGGSGSDNDVSPSDQEGSPSPAEGVPAPPPHSAASGPPPAPALGDSDAVNGWGNAVVAEIAALATIGAAREYVRALYAELDSMENADPDLAAFCRVLREKMEARIDALQPGQETLGV